MSALYAPSHPDEFLALSTTTFDDVPRHAQALPGWDLTYAQLSRGRYSGSVAQARLKGIQLFRERTNASANQYGRGPRGSVIFGLPIGRSGDCMVNGTRLPPSGINVVRGERGLDVTMPPSEFLVLAVDQDMLEDYLQTMEQISVRGWAEHGPLHIELAELAGSMTAQLLRVHGELFAGAPVPDSPWFLSAIRHHLLAQAASVVSATKREVVRPLLAPFSRSLIVRKAREWIMDRMDEPLQVIDLCRELRVSRRALQVSFQAVVGTSPASYLRLMRLNGARRDLLGCEDGSLQIKDVVERWGFWHVSRFSGEYRQLFGELPSQTLRASSKLRA